MKTFPLWATLLAATALPGTALAADKDLPPAATVEQALSQTPEVDAAKARVSSAQSASEALRYGPHELTVEGSFAQRDIDRDGRYGEYEIGVSRAIRLPGKAALDREVGARGLRLAQSQIVSARHNAALSLGTLWYDWLVATALHRNAVHLVSNQESLLKATKRRQELHDASAIEVEQAATALALTQIQRENAQALQDRNRALLEARFPELPLPADAPLMQDPRSPSAGLEDLVRLIEERHHAITSATLEADLQDALASRARAERTADPSVGLYGFSERNGEEKGAGISLSVPLGGGHRRALADQAAAEANAARAELLLSQRSVTAEAKADTAEYRRRYSAWQAAQSAVASAERAAELTARGHHLGAIDLADVLYAQRQAHEARTEEIIARSAAAQLFLKLRVNAQELWVLPGQ